MFGNDFLDRHLPVGIEFNAAVMTLANRANPLGWGTADNINDVPQNLPELNAYIHNHGRVVVWTGASENTIFGDAEHNYAFRAWHDALHYAMHAEFNLMGEWQVAVAQTHDLFQLYGVDEETIVWAARLLSDTIGQAKVHHHSTAFPSDQVALNNMNYGFWLKSAQELATTFNPDYNDAYTYPALKRLATRMAEAVGVKQTGLVL